MKLKFKDRQKYLQQIRAADKLYLFLDYDGTLAEFAPTPDDIHPDLELIDLLGQFVRHPQIHTAIISGRRLSHIRKLIPVSGLLLAGTYGIEMITPSGERVERVDFQSVRPYLENIKPQWKELIRPFPEFYLEDKGWSLALHAKQVDRDRAEKTLQQARERVIRAELPTNLFQLLGGDKFLEIAPIEANKGLTIDYLLARHPHKASLAVYIGDDDKDEEAFKVIIENGGIAIKVCRQPCETSAQLRLKSPPDVRQFLTTLLKNNPY
jgi:trehalose 6-phosphate phosphatase